MDGSTRCAAASWNVSQSPCSAVSISSSPVMRSGGNETASSRPGPGAQFEPAVEDRQHNEGQPEGRRRDADQRDRTGDMVDPAVSPHRRQHAERQADQEGKDEGDRRELERRGRVVDDVLQHRPARGDRDAEIAMQPAAPGTSSSAATAAGRGPTWRGTPPPAPGRRPPCRRAAVSTGSPGTVLAIRKMTSVASSTMATETTRRETT